MTQNQKQNVELTSDEAGVRACIDKYITAVRERDEASFRDTFNPDANIAHYYVKGDEVRTIGLDAFVGTIHSLHEKFDNAEEVVRDMEVQIIGPLASVRLAFTFIMGTRSPQGEDLFALAKVKGEWKIVHKSYFL